MDTETTSAEDGDRQAKHLRVLRDRIRRIGKKSSSDVFELGAVLEEAAELLRGRFGVWVEHECGIEPRTAHGYRRAHAQLEQHKNLLIEKRVLPTVIIKLAGAEDDARTEAMRLIESGRRLKVRDVQSLIKHGTLSAGISAKPSQGKSPLKGLIGDVAARAEARLATLVSQLDRQDDKRGKPAKALRQEAGTLATGLAGLLDLMPRSEIAITDSWIRLKDALADFSSVSAGRNGPSAADAVLSAYQALYPKDPATGRSAESGTARPPAPATVPGIFRKRIFVDQPLTALEVCAGAGGQAIGIERAGFRHVALVERDPDACRTLRANLPGANVVEQDLLAFDASPYHDVDLFCGGVPCQPFSQAGKMRGPDDERDLFMEAIRIIEQTRPRAILLENVRGLLYERFDAYRLDILEQLKRLGYDAQWQSLNASHFGVPQARVRSFLVGFRDKAMQRFVWPMPDPRYVETPWTISAALYSMVAARDWKGIEKWAEKAHVVASTIIGGSTRKQGMDLGQRKSQIVWADKGVNGKTIANCAPGPDDDEENVTLTLSMLAYLQDFPGGWQFQGSRQAIFRQIANGLPSTVALHLGCAIRSTLTGTYIDPEQVVRRYYNRTIAGTPIIHVRPVVDAKQGAPAIPPKPARQIMLPPLAELMRRNPPQEPDGFGYAP
ncbi:DNA cytosine methyltransferase [Microvirga sp. P5_D2]